MATLWFSPPPTHSARNQAACAERSSRKRCRAVRQQNRGSTSPEAMSTFSAGICKRGTRYNILEVHSENRKGEGGGCSCPAPTLHTPPTCPKAHMPFLVRSSHPLRQRYQGLGCSEVQAREWSAR